MKLIRMVRTRTLDEWWFSLKPHPENADWRELPIDLVCELGTLRVSHISRPMAEKLYASIVLGSDRATETVMVRNTDGKPLVSIVHSKTPPPKAKTPKKLRTSQPVGKRKK